MSSTSRFNCMCVKVITDTKIYLTIWMENYTNKGKTVYPFSFGPRLYKYLYPLTRSLSSDNA